MQPYYGVLAEAINLSPTSKEQHAFTKLVHTMERAGETSNAIILAIVEGIGDGIKHGNWPS